MSSSKLALAVFLSPAVAFVCFSFVLGPVAECRVIRERDLRQVIIRQHTGRVPTMVWQGTCSSCSKPFGMKKPRRGADDPIVDTGPTERV